MHKIIRNILMFCENHERIIGVLGKQKWFRKLVRYEGKKIAEEFDEYLEWYQQK